MRCHSSAAVLISPTDRRFEPGARAAPLIVHCGKAVHQLGSCKNALDVKVQVLSPNAVSVPLKQGLRKFLCRQLVNTRLERALRVHPLIKVLGTAACLRSHRKRPIFRSNRTRSLDLGYHWNETQFEALDESVPATTRIYHGAMMMGENP